MLREFLSRLFPIFTEIRLTVKPNQCYIWFFTIFLLIQNTFTSFFSDRPSVLINSNEQKAPGVFTLLTFLFIPWYDYSNFILFDVFLILFLQIFLLISLCIAVHKKNLGIFISHFHLTTLYYLILLLALVLSVPLYFRLAHSLDQIVLNQNLTSIFAFVITFICIIIHFFVVYLKSIFLDQFDFIPESTFSLYEGKSSVLYEFIHFLSILSCFVTPFIENVSVRQGIASLALVIAVIGFYFRILPCPHFSIIGQFFDASFIFFISPLLILRSILDSFQNFMILVYFLFLILCFLILYIMRKQVTKRSIAMFNIFANIDVNTETFSTDAIGISPHNYVTVIRFYALNISDPTVFEKFRQMQQLFNRNKSASIQIEVFRFLALFPSKRHQILREIEQTNSNSLYNRFMLHLFYVKLTGLTSRSSKSDRLMSIDLFSSYSHYLIKYWKSRVEKKKIDAFINGLNAAIVRNELKREIKMLLIEFPFDPKIRKMYINFLSIANGDSEKIRNQIKILDGIKQKAFRIPDPLLHRITSFNPRILRYLSKSERETSSCLATVEKSMNEQTDHSIDNLTKPRKIHLVTSFLPFLYQALVIFLLTALMIRYEKNASIISDKTFEVSNLTIDKYFISSATFFVYFADMRTMTNESFDLSDDVSCCNYLIQLGLNEKQYFIDNPSLLPFSEYGTLSSIEFYVRKSNFTICEIVEYMNNHPTTELSYQFNETIDALTNTLHQIYLEMKNFTNRDIFILVILMYFIGFVLFSFLFGFGFYIVLNSKMSDLSQYFPILSSKERRDLIQNGEALKSWNLFNESNRFDAMNINSPRFGEMNMNSAKKVNYNGLKSFTAWYLNFWFDLFFVLIIITVPHILRDQLQSESHNQFQHTYELSKNVIYLVSNITNSILGHEIDIKLLQKGIIDLKNSANAISYQFANKTISVPSSLQFTESATMASLVDLYLTNSLSDGLIESLFVPNLFEFSRFAVIDVFVTESNRREIFHTEAVISFSLMVFILIIILIANGYDESRKINKSISKLFIFPQFLTQNQDQNSNSGLDMPENLLIITVITQTMKIYSVSENSTSLINRNPSSLINSNFFDLFQFDSNNSEYLLFNFNEKKTKSFQLKKKIEQGQITHYLLLEDSNKVLSNLPNVSVSTQLSNFMTSFFADQFSSENVDSIILTNSFFLFIKIKTTNIDINTIESAYSTFYNQLTKSYPNVKCLNVDGSIIELAISNSSSCLIPLLFLKDILNNKKLVVGINSIFVDFIDEVRYELNCVDEPCVVCNNETISFNEKIVLRLISDTFAISPQLLEQLPNISNQFTLQNFDVDLHHRQTECAVISFSQFLNIMNQSLI